MTIKQLIILGIGIILVSFIMSCDRGDGFTNIPAGNPSIYSKSVNYQVETKFIWIEDNRITVIKGSDGNWYLKQHTYMYDIYVPYNSDL
jgi:hypothetical protein